MCSSQRSRAFELAAATEQLKVGGGYTELIKAKNETRMLRIVKLLTFDALELELP